MPAVSISVPIYNVENYLEQCLDALMSQTLNDIEIILVDDGSLDSSGAICDRYAAADERVVVIHKGNGGLASARQAGLDIATGKYFCVCDADDWPEPDMYEQLYKKAIDTDADIVMCDYWSEYPDGKKVIHQYPYRLENRKDLLDDALNKRFPTMVWNKLFKRDVFEKYRLSWDLGVNMGEDLLMMLKILCHPQKLAYQPIPLYHYRRIMGGSSYTNSVSLSTFNQLLRVRIWSDENIDKNKYENGLFIQWLDQAFAGLRLRERMPVKYFKDTTLINIPYSGFCKYSYPKLKGLIVLISKLFGYRIGRAIVQIMYRFIYH